MQISITPKKLSGSIEAVSSKSYAHRVLIAAALADAPTDVHINVSSEDIEATLRCIKALGAKTEKTENGFTVYPIDVPNENAVLDCGESGSTARFMLAVCAALCGKANLVGSGRLPERPMKELAEALESGGARCSGDFLPLTVCGRLHSGVYKLRGDISSQFITGLMLALAMVEGESEIQLITKTESAAYVDITVDVLKQFGIEVLKTNGGYKIFGGKYISPKKIDVEGDWSNAAFWLAASRMGGSISVSGLNPASRQGDKAFQSVIAENVIDASQIPDLVPIIAVYAASKKAVTEIVGAVRLRLKESDRIKTTVGLINSLGGKAEETDSGLVICGNGRLCGGVADGAGDHRIVMSAAIAATICGREVVINGAEAVKKSYPTFFEDYKKLGGEIHVL